MGIRKVAGHLPHGDLRARNGTEDFDAASLTASTVEGRGGSSLGAAGEGRPGLVIIFPRLLQEAPLIFRIGSPAVIGRGRGPAIPLDDPKVSRAHAEVRATAEGLVVKDLGSRHGTTTGGRAVRGDPVPVPFDTVVRLGDTLLLAVRDVERYRVPPRRITGSALGLQRDLLAGPLLSEVWDQATRAAALAYPVLVLGESGSGKENVARLVHHAAGSGVPFVGINVAAVPDALFEAELFGHARGAFTGATSARLGAFREADGGFLFLDEIAELRVDLQAKLLRAIDLQVVRPLGSDRDVPVRVRIVAATSRDLRQACDTGAFRPDLFYRLSGVVIRVPPLRARPDDITLLALATLAAEAPELRLSADAAHELLLARWDGNVRSLRSAVAHAVTQATVAGSRSIQAEHLPDGLNRVGTEPDLSEDSIRAAMTRAQGVAAKAAGMLGVSRTTFYNSCRRMGIDAASMRTGIER
jgi:DNA-binding NtrC family response regulator